MEVSQEEFQEWLLHPVTRAFRAKMMESRERLKESWAQGAFRGDHALEARVQGQCEILKQILDAETPSDIETES